MSTGSDGLSKLWTIKTSECNTTLDDHEDKVWALALREHAASIRSREIGTDENEQGDAAQEENVLSEKSCLVATGGGDALVTIYRDVTVESLRQLHKQEEERLLQEQSLSNAIQMKDYSKAIRLTIRLNQPGRLCNLFSDILAMGRSERDDNAVLGKTALDDVVGTLSMNHLEAVLRYVRDWNTNAKHARVAQAVLHVILRKFCVSQLIVLPNIKEVRRFFFVVQQCI
jgi:U3 small nucleolar RNA-associated protein 13